MHRYSSLLFPIIAAVFLLAACEGTSVTSSYGDQDPVDESISCVVNFDCPGELVCLDGTCAPVVDGDVPDGDGETGGEAEKEVRIDGDLEIVLDGDRPDGDGPDTDLDTSEGDDPEVESDGEEQEHGTVGLPCEEHTECFDGIFCNGTEICGPEKRCILGAEPCIDDYVCTEDICDEETRSCDVISHDERCDDDNPCNGEETCDVGLGCISGTPMDCSDGIDCTEDSCHPEGCRNEPVDDNCSDDISCTIDTCQAGQGCLHSTNHAHCPENHLCEPSDPEADSDSGCVERSRCEKDEDCDDHLWCTGEETCTETFCFPGATVDCNDGHDCTEDMCQEALRGCLHDPDDGLCQDGNLCNGVESCSADAGCLLGEILDCDDEIECTMDSCEPAEGCLHEAIDVVCADAYDCTSEECDLNSGCVVKAHHDLCDDEIDCSDNICDPHTGCRFELDDLQCPEGQVCDALLDCIECYQDSDCLDAEVCNGAESCWENFCLSGTAPDCEAGLSGHQDRTWCDDGCQYDCEDDFLDCNEDLGDPQGNGCESLAGTLDSCTDCEDECEGPDHSISTCEDDGCHWTCREGHLACGENCYRIYTMQYLTEYSFNTCNEAYHNFDAYDCGGAGSTGGASGEILLKWTADRSKLIYFGAEPTSQWDLLIVRLTAACSSNCQQYKNSAGVSAYEYFTFNAVAGETYYFTVDAVSNNQCGSFRVAVAEEEDINCQSVRDPSPETLYWLIVLAALLVLRRRKQVC